MPVPRRMRRGGLLGVPAGIERRPTPAAWARERVFDVAGGDAGSCGFGGGASEGLGEGVDLVVVGAEWEPGGFFDQVLDPGRGAGAVVVGVVGVGCAGQVDVSGFDLGADG